eukprot:CAMPEP_0172326148 /NCGR_PEP_ID=MMETSP1058-20130122/55721_1 /TAXON_ID=83371 /ORGANISM="Detonula confervacea, Strain CCMP 353" /LENGTH=347 /DNA_ID=CAMNT_0013042857 /DNA_START=22 /DNA_END=1065 /DNA_ORIENTATION=+
MPKGHHSKFFPGKLRIMLDEVDGIGLSHGSSWVSEGCAFAIHEPDVFMNEIAPQFFDKQTHLRSFHRQLSIWGFTRLETGAGGRGVWFHTHFIREKPELTKHIKRVPVKNPKPNMSTPKNQLPDYTKYQLPVSIHQDSQHSAKGHHSMASMPVPVHQPHRNVAAAAAAVKSALPESNFLPAHIKGPMPPPSLESLNYLSTFGHMPPAAPPSYVAAHNAVSQMPISSAPPILSDQARRYPSFILTNYQPSVVTSMNYPLAPSAGNPNVPFANDLGELAQQLLGSRQNPPSPNQLGADGSSNLDDAILAMIIDSRRRDPPTSNNGTGLSQELLSALVRRNLLPHGPTSS